MASPAAHLLVHPAAHLDQFDGADDLVNWSGNPNASVELRGILQSIPGLEFAGYIKYPHKGRPPFAQIQKAGITQNSVKNVELGMGLKVDMNDCSFLKASILIEKDSLNAQLKDRLVFKSGVTTKVDKTKVCCGVQIKRKANPLIPLIPLMHHLASSAAAPCWRGLPFARFLLSWLGGVCTCS